MGLWQKFVDFLYEEDDKEIKKEIAELDDELRKEFASLNKRLARLEEHLGDSKNE